VRGNSASRRLNSSLTPSMQDTADDFVIATGETRSVRDFCTEAFKVAGMPLRWEGSGAEVRLHKCARNVLHLVCQVGKCRAHTRRAGDWRVHDRWRCSRARV
jgi:GDP-D-mannose dehydratase